MNLILDLFKSLLWGSTTIKLGLSFMLTIFLLFSFCITLICLGGIFGLVVNYSLIWALLYIPFFWIFTWTASNFDTLIKKHFPILETLVKKHFPM
jgi:hypothetical protein